MLSIVAVVVGLLVVLGGAVLVGMAVLKKSGSVVRKPSNPAPVAQRGRDKSITEGTAGLAEGKALDAAVPVSSQHASAEPAQDSAIKEGLPVKIRGVTTPRQIAPNLFLQEGYPETNRYVTVEAEVPWNRLPIQSMKGSMGSSGSSASNQLYLFRAVPVTEFRLVTPSADTYECIANAPIRDSGTCYDLVGNGKWFMSGSDDSNRAPAFVALLLNGEPAKMTAHDHNGRLDGRAYKASDDPNETTLFSFAVPTNVPLEKLYLKFSTDEPVPLIKSQ